MLSLQCLHFQRQKVRFSVNKYGMICDKIHEKSVNGEDFKNCHIELKAATVCKNIRLEVENQYLSLIMRVFVMFILIHHNAHCLISCLSHSLKNVVSLVQLV